MRSIIAVMTLVLMLLSTPSIHAQKTKKSGGKNPYVNEKFTAKDGTSIEYKIMAPKTIEDGRKYPLILALHGRGGSTAAAAKLASNELREKFSLLCHGA